MAKTELTILVVFAHSIDMTLLAEEEAKVVTTGHTFDLDAFTEGHLDWVANLLPLHSEWPSKGFATLTCGQG